MNYLKLLSILTLLFNFANCSQPEINYYEKIQGDWKMIQHSDINTYVSAFSFEDSFCLNFDHLWYYSKFEITEDSLFVIHEEPYLDTFKYQILDITDTSLTLQQSDEALYFQKFKPKNNITFNRIAFGSSVSLSKAPIIYFEIDSVGNINFHGFSWEKYSGFYRSKLSTKEMAFIQSKINLVDWENIKPYYEPIASDGQKRYIRLVTNEKSYDSEVYNSKFVPSELRLLLSKLIDLPNRMTLVSDSTFNRNEFHFDIYNRFIPPPPPDKK
jgi:hypothetical protein